ncbi:hemophore [Mycolicibacterium canariasense]|uniref:hemophore n=1 Tax=Mycolicibacterium canariasense TaxID=228230 RepID=UPI000787B536|nr:hemophore [Mycolicibacterium canariasense]MCV7207608.1 hemophore [Mycolicibacterium canariasense]ORV08979.1 Fis family transcriptional regulator [Mycolicibacterium canariasense]
MSSLPRSLRRALFGTFAVSAFGGVLTAGLLTPAAGAATDPCAASQIAKTIGSVATSTGSYLDAHPETNQALTTIAQMPAGPQSLAATKSYFDANPQAGKDMQQLQQPLVSLSTQCRLPITVPQLLGLMQAAQNAGGGLPAALAPAQSLGAASTSANGSSTTTAPATGGATGTGPLPGPAAVTPR